MGNTFDKIKGEKNRILIDNKFHKFNTYDTIDNYNIFDTIDNYNIFDDKYDYDEEIALLPDDCYNILIHSVKEYPYVY